MKNENLNIETKITYLLIGGGIGAVLALLFAPKTGQEFRANIADATRKSIDKTEEIAGQLSEKAQTVYGDTKIKAGEIYDSAKQKINSAAMMITEIPENLQNAVQDKVEQISSTLEAGKKEYVREAGLHNRKAGGM